MGSMVMSTLMMFVPWHVEFLFIIIAAVGFFGIYIPWNEWKKKKNLKKMLSSAWLGRLEVLKEEGLLSEEEYGERRAEMSAASAAHDSARVFARKDGPVGE